MFGIQLKKLCVNLKLGFQCLEKELGILSGEDTQSSYRRLFYEIIDVYFIDEIICNLNKHNP